MRIPSMWSCVREFHEVRVSEPLKFGEVAVELGLLHPYQVKRALKVQSSRETRGLPVPMMGEVLQRLGYLTDEQVLQVMETTLSVKRRKKPAKPSLWARLFG